MRATRLRCSRPLLLPLSGCLRACRQIYAFVEVGLGGRLDATNVVNPVACAITSISLDHQDFLGTTLTEIAG